MTTTCLLVVFSLAGRIDLNVWPRPQQFKHTGGHAVLDPSSFAFIHSLHTHSPSLKALETAIATHKRILFSQLPAVPYDDWMHLEIDSISPNDLKEPPKLDELIIEIEVINSIPNLPSFHRRTVHRTQTSP